MSDANEYTLNNINNDVNTKMFQENVDTKRGNIIDWVKIFNLLLTEDNVSMIDSSARKDWEAKNPKHKET